MFAFPETGQIRNRNLTGLDLHLRISHESSSEPFLAPSTSILSAVRSGVTERSRFSISTTFVTSDPRCLGLSEPTFGGDRSSSLEELVSNIDEYLTSCQSSRPQSEVRLLSLGASTKTKAS